jgi:hypothetical protein
MSEFEPNEVFSILSDVSGSGVDADEIQTGFPLSGKRGILAFGFKNVSGDAEIPLIKDGVQYVTDITLDGDQIDGVILVGTSPVPLRVGGSNLPDRSLLYIQPYDNNIWFGMTSGVSVSGGMKLFKDQIIPFPFGPNTTPYVVSNASGRKIYVLEKAT